MHEGGSHYCTRHIIMRDRIADSSGSSSGRVHGYRQYERIFGERTNQIQRTEPAKIMPKNAYRRMAHTKQRHARTITVPGRGWSGRSIGGAERKLSCTDTPYVRPSVKRRTSFSRVSRTDEANCIASLSCCASVWISGEDKQKQAGDKRHSVGRTNRDGGQRDAYTAACRRRKWHTNQKGEGIEGPGRMLPDAWGWLDGFVQASRGTISR